MEKVIIIPARMQSKRFPGKVFHPIAGIPMIIRTWQQAMKVPDCAVYIASDDFDLLASCQEYGCRVIKTGDHKNGTERCAEAASILKLEDGDYVLNLQADLPCINPKLLESVMLGCSEQIITAAVIVQGKPSADQNLVKITCDKYGVAIYFSRSPIPINADVWYNHIGIYRFQNKFLQEFAAQGISPLEDQEDLEQLRIIWNNKRRIDVILTQEDCISINVPSDLEKLNIQWPEGPVLGHVI